MEVPCGKCGNCLKNRKEEWTFRLNVELQNSETAHFVTLTYEDEYVPIQNGTGTEILEKSDLQDFFKRLRYYHAIHSRSQIRYYAVGEYGTNTFRPHYHAIIFNARRSDIEKAWQIGFISYGKVQASSIGYVLGYIASTDNHSVSRGVPKQFAIMSKRPALGHDYLRTHSKWHQDGLRNFTSTYGKKGRLARYYKKQIFNDVQKQTVTENAVLAYERQFESTVNYYKNLGHSDPYGSASAYYKNNEQKLFEKINENKKHI